MKRLLTWWKLQWWKVQVRCLPDAQEFESYSNIILIGTRAEIDLMTRRFKRWMIFRYRWPVLSYVLMVNHALVMRRHRL